MPGTKAENRQDKGGIKAGTLVKGMAGVAATAGIVAAGVMLANRKNRRMVGKTLKKGLKSVGEITSQMAEEGKNYMPTGAIAHRVGMGGRKKKTQSKSSRAKRGRKVA